MRFSCLLLGMLLVAGAGAEPLLVGNDAELRAALRVLKDGDTLRIAPGTYSGGHHVTGVSRLTIEGADAENPPLFQGGGTGLQFSRCTGLTLRNLRVSGQKFNGLNLDDGGRLDQPVGGITLERVAVSDIGPQGNFDGIKCSGLDGLTLRDCTVSGWGGQGIDMVGCHRVLITGCRLTGKPGFTASAGIQMKGGSSGITVEKCVFLNAGERPLNIGGSTGLAFFRPQGVRHEAARVVVRGNVIEGSPCAAAFVGVDGAEFVENTIRYPTKWIFRILQETVIPEFVPCRNVVIRDNRITFRRAEVREEINIGPRTAPETFRFECNRWLAEDRPGASTPSLPVAESGGVYGKPAE